MKTLFPLAALLSCGLAVAAPPSPADSPDSKKARELTAQLASPKYRERERAAAELIKMGRSAKPALQEGAKSPDPEVQTRCQQLLPQALALDLNFRIDRFLKDTDGKLTHDLPLWKTYREKVGSDENARKLFADMLRANGALLEAAEEEPGKLTDLVQRRSQEMYQELFGNPFGGGFRGGYRPNALNVADLCCLMFAASNPAYKPAQPDYMLVNLYSQAPFTNQLRDEKAGSAYRKVFFTFLDARMDENTLNQAGWILCQFRIKEGADVLAKALTDGKATQVYSKANALCCLGTIGGKEHLKTVEPFLKDATEMQQFVGRAGQRTTIKVKDVALAITIHLSGKNPKDYGFAQWMVIPNNPIQYHLLGFASDEERGKAFEKWEAEGKKPAEKKDEPKK